jgi:hypothetical protein
MNLSDYVLENLKLKEELSDAYEVISDIKSAYDHYEREGAISELEGNALIYAEVLENINDSASSFLEKYK